MNRTKAKLMTIFGLFLSSTALGLFIWNIVNRNNSGQIAFSVIFVAGIVLIIFSLAYYTDK